MQLAAELCCTYSMIFITLFLKSNINYIQPQGRPLPPRQILGAHQCSLEAARVRSRVSKWNTPAHTELLPRSWNFSIFIPNIFIMRTTTTFEVPHSRQVA
jgi:hypothetical protein